jgi:HEAT repeat protein
MSRLAIAGLLGLGLLAPATFSFAQDINVASWQILESAQTSRSTQERVMAVRALGLLPENPRAEKLAEGALADKKPEVRAAAAASLGRMHSLASIPRLEEALNDKDTRVSFAAASALLTLGDSAGYTLYYEVLIGERKSGEGPLEDQKRLVKDNRALAMMGLGVGMGFVPYSGYGWAMFQLLSKDYDGPVLVAAAQKLADDPDPHAVRALVEAASSKNWKVRQAALDALALRRDPHLLDSVSPHLADKRKAVRCAAAAAVVRLSAAVQEAKAGDLPGAPEIQK